MEISAFNNVTIEALKMFKIIIISLTGIVNDHTILYYLNFEFVEKQGRFFNGKEGGILSNKLEGVTQFHNLSSVVIYV